MLTNKDELWLVSISSPALLAKQMRRQFVQSVDVTMSALLHLGCTASQLRLSWPHRGNAERRGSTRQRGTERERKISLVSAQ